MPSLLKLIDDTRAIVEILYADEHHISLTRDTRHRAMRLVQEHLDRVRSEAVNATTSAANEPVAGSEPEVLPPMPQPRAITR